MSVLRTPAELASDLGLDASKVTWPLVQLTDDLYVQWQQGTGDNLLPEDEDDGFVDYLWYTAYRSDHGLLAEWDSGQVLLGDYYGVRYEHDLDALPTVLANLGITHFADGWPRLVATGVEAESLNVRGDCSASYELVRLADGTPVMAWVVRRADDTIVCPDAETAVAHMR